MEPRVFRNPVHEGGSKKPRARLTDDDNNVLVQADFTGSVQVRVFDLSDDPTAAIFSNTRTVGATVLNSLQDWEVDADGYNFSDSITSNEVGGWKGGHSYRISYLLTHSTDGYYPVIFEIRCLNLYGL